MAGDPGKNIYISEGKSVGMNSGENKDAAGKNRGKSETILSFLRKYNFCMILKIFELKSFFASKKEYSYLS